MNMGLSQYQGRPLRIMQVIPFYPPYLKQFYEHNPTLAEQSFSVQNKAFIQDGFSAIHIFTPYLTGCETLLAIPNCAPLQRAWLREHGQTLDSEHDWQNEILRRQVAHFKPDILYSDAESSFTDFVHSLPHPRPKIIAWRSADVHIGSQWQCYDAILSNLPKLLALAKSLGAKECFSFHPGVPSWIAKEVSSLPQKVDVVFVGSIYAGQHERRWALLEALAVGAAKHHFSLELFLSCDAKLITAAMRPYVRPPIFGLDMHKALRRGKIVFNSHGTAGARKPDGSYAFHLVDGGAVNMRLFEGTSGGSLLLTEHPKDLSLYFDPKDELATYSDENDAIEKILYYLEHEEERERIAKAGQVRCLKDWSMQRTATHFLEIAQHILTKNMN